MKLYRESSLENFEPWSGAVSTYNRIWNEGKMSEFEQLLEDLYPDGIEETALNDILWFEEEWVYDELGIRSYDTVYDELETAKQELADLISDRDEELEDCETEEEVTAVMLEYDEEISEKQEEIDDLVAELEEIKSC